MLSVDREFSRHDEHTRRGDSSHRWRSPLESRACDKGCGGSLASWDAVGGPSFSGSSAVFVRRRPARGATTLGGQTPCGVSYRQGRHESGAWPINTQIEALTSTVESDVPREVLVARLCGSASTGHHPPSLSVFLLLQPPPRPPPLPIVPHSCCPAPFVTLITYGYGCAGCSGGGCAGRGGGGVGTESCGGGQH